MTDLDPTEPLQPHQRALWAVLTWNYPSSICKTLRRTAHLHSDELHRLYALLAGAHREPPARLLAAVTALPESTAGEMVAALADIGVRATHQPGPYKPLFYSAEREELWFVVLELFGAGFLGRGGDGSARQAVADFRTLHMLYRLDMEDQRARRKEDTGLRDPNHEWYHSAADELVEQWLRRLRPLAEQGRRDEVPVKHGSDEMDIPEDVCD